MGAASPAKQDRGIRRRQDAPAGACGERAERGRGRGERERERKGVPVWRPKPPQGSEES